MPLQKYLQVHLHTCTGTCTDSHELAQVVAQALVHLRKQLRTCALNDLHMDMTGDRRELTADARCKFTSISRQLTVHISRSMVLSELQSAKSTYQHADLDLYRLNTHRLEFDSRSSEVIRVFLPPKTIYSSKIEMNKTPR